MEDGVASEAPEVVNGWLERCVLCPDQANDLQPILTPAILVKYSGKQKQK